MKARAAHHSRQTRRFKVPAKLNLDAVEYFDMIDWTVCPISEPLVLEAMTDAVTLGSRISSCKDGARHLHQMLVKSRYLNPKHKKIVDPVIHRNAYFAHPDNLLLAMMTDHRRAARHSGQIRRFKVRRWLQLSSSQNFPATHRLWKDTSSW